MDCRVKPGNDSGGSHPHRHQHVERALVVLVLHQRRRAGVGEAEYGDFALDLGGDVEQVARVETDIEEDWSDQDVAARAEAALGRVVI